jgi:hypothetical protein
VIIEKEKEKEFKKITIQQKIKAEREQHNRKLRESAKETFNTRSRELQN